MSETKAPGRRARANEANPSEYPHNVGPRPLKQLQQGRTEPYRTPAGDDPGARRIEEIRAKRRERGTVDVSGLRQNLSIPEEYKDPRFVYRWVLDKSTRHYEMKARDWEYADSEEVAQDERNSGTGTRIERIGNERTVPKPEKVFLMRKPREFYEEDKASEQENIRQNEEGIRRGLVKNEQGQAEQGMYIPSSGMKIDRGR